MFALVPVSKVSVLGPIICTLTRWPVMFAGNVATEDVVYMLNGLGVKHGVDMNKLLDVNEFISHALNKPNSSRAARALLAARGVDG